MLVMSGVRNRSFFTIVGLVVMLLASSCAGSTQASTTKSSTTPVDHFNAPGNVLISDQFNNRVVEVARDGHIVWSFGSGNPTLCNPGPGTIIGLNDAERLSGGLTLLAGTGIPAGSASYPKGCNDNRVIVVNQQGSIVWQYGQAGVTGSGPNQLNVPVFAIQLPDHNIMVVDQGNNRVIEIDKASNTAPLPTNAVQLADGSIMIADQFNNRVLLINPTLQFQYGTVNVTGNGPDQLNGPYTSYVIGDYTGQTPPPATL